jgi:hypothetical protein
VNFPDSVSEIADAVCTITDLPDSVREIPGDVWNIPSLAVESDFPDSVWKMFE